MSKKMLLIDADTFIVQSAAKEQILLCEATHEKSGRKKVWPSKTAFNNWLKENPKWENDTFTFNVIQEPVGTVANACHSMKQKITWLLDHTDCDDFRICIQGSGNYRKLRNAKFVNYKGQRGSKPLFCEDVFEYTKRKWKDKVVVSEGIETDDYICIQGWKYYQNGDQDSLLIAYCDKDLPQNIVGNMANYLQPEYNPFFNTPEMQYKGFWTSVLVGDQADNIPGIGSISEETRVKYGIRKNKDNACGPVSAGRILAGVESEKECAERVMEAYALRYPDDWKFRIDEMCFFLWLQRYDGDMFKFKSHVIDRLKIDC